MAPSCNTVSLMAKSLLNVQAVRQRHSLPLTLSSSVATIISLCAYFPRAPGAHPAVVFLHGSGDEGMFANQYLAEFLASNGIVSAIQDKQGVGRSSGDWRKASFEDLADDYSAVIDWLRISKTSGQGSYRHLRP